MRLPHIAMLVFPGVTSDALFYALTQKGLHATFGGNQMQHLVHILKACSIASPDCYCGLSFAFSPTTTEEEILRGAALVAETARELQKYSQQLCGAVL